MGKKGSILKKIDPLHLVKHKQRINREDLKDISNAVSYLTRYRRQRSRWIILAFYWGISGFIFDLLNPEVGFITQVFGFSDTISQNYPTNWISAAGDYFTWNIIVAGLAIILILVLKSVYVLGPLVGIAFASIGYYFYLHEIIGIITITWHAIFGAIALATILLDGISHDIWIEVVPLCSDMQNASSKEELQDIQLHVKNLNEGLWNLIKLLIQGFLSFTAITGVTMSILFREGFGNTELKMTAIQMTSGFLMSGLCLYSFIGIPIMRRIGVTNSLMRFRISSIIKDG